MNFTEKYNKHYGKNILLAKQVKLKKKNLFIKINFTIIHLIQI